MIDIRNLSEEKPLNLPAAAAYIGKLTGKNPHVSTLWRWCQKGCKGTRLESICVGGNRYVTVSAIERFIEARSHTPTTDAVTAVAIARSVAPHVERHEARRRAEIEAARQRLDELTHSHRQRGGTAPSRSA